MTTIFDGPGSNTWNPSSTPIQALLASINLSSAPASTQKETAAHVFTTVTASPDPVHALWELWDVFFTAVAISSATHVPHLALLNALHMQPPTQPKNVSGGSNVESQLRSYTQPDGKLRSSALPRFSARGRDVHDILEAWRDWDGVRTSGADD